MGVGVEDPIGRRGGGTLYTKEIPAKMMRALVEPDKAEMGPWLSGTN